MLSYPPPRFEVEVRRESDGVYCARFVLNPDVELRGSDVQSLLLEMRMVVIEAFGLYEYEHSEVELIDAKLLF